MFLRQIYDSHLSQYAYVIGCQRTGEAIVIDPERDIDRYRAVAEEEGLRLTAVAETHLHADFVSGARELAADPTVRAYVSAEGGPAWQSEWACGLANARLLRDEDTFQVGHIEFQALHMPGHTPEHMVYLVTDRGGGANEPLALLTGDFLFVGDVGRPDLLEQAAGIAGAQELGARQLYASLRRLTDLADHLEILPAHGAGSACGKALGSVPFSTLGYERKFNPALRQALHGSEADFVAFILRGQPEPPAYFAQMKRVNRAGPALLGAVPQPPWLDLDAVRARLGDPGFVVLDTRSSPIGFLARHLPGSIFAPAVKFSDFAGSFLAPESEIVLVASDAANAGEYVRQLVRIGFDRVAGLLPLRALEGVSDGVLQRTRTISFAEAPALLANGNGGGGARVLDVRRATEYAEAHLRGAQNIAHTRLRLRLDEVPPDGGPVLVHCASGLRATAAGSYLERYSREPICIVDSFANAPVSLCA